MKIRHYGAGLCIAVLAACSISTGAHAQPVSRDSLEKLSKDQLIQMVLDLSGNGTSSDKGLRIGQELRQGMSGQEVRELQQILATDPTVYPEGLVTGFFGPLTANAVGRLQAKFRLESRGVVNADTLALINSLLEAQGVTGTVIPQDVLSAGASRIKVEVKNNNGKIEYKIEIKCDSSGKGNSCKDADDEDEDTARDSEEEGLEIEAEIEDGEAKVKVEQDGDKESFTLRLTDHSAIIEEVADRLDLSESEVEDVITFDDEGNHDKSDEDGDDHEDDDHGSGGHGSDD